MWFHPGLLCPWVVDNLRTGSPFQSPALLQLSGVRDSDVLVIDTRFYLKTVGKNLLQKVLAIMMLIIRRHDLFIIPRP